MKKIDFNLNWTVEKDGTGIRHAVSLPHDCMIFERREKESPTGGAGAYFLPGKYIYRKTFAADPAWKNGRVILECEAVYKNAEVLLNGKSLAFHAYGYTGFFIDLGDALNYEGENELTVIADNSKAPNSRWYSGSGMIRPAFLYVGPASSIAPDGIHVTTPELSKVCVNVECCGCDAAETDILVEILDGDTVIASGEGASVELEIPDARPWSDETPELYTCRAVLRKDGEETDCAETAFGFRTLSWGGKGLFVNGKETLLRGACIHHDNGILGAAAFADAEERRVRILKEAGFNAIRSAHNPISRSMLEACDRLGMYIMDESFDMWLIHKNPYDYAKEDFGKYWKEDTKAMVNRDYSHPSVILYSIGNEISDLGSAEGQELCREMADYVRSLDSTRPVTLGVNLMLANMVAKGKGLYGNAGDSAEDEEKKPDTEGIMSAPTSEFFNILMNRLGNLMDRASSGKGPDKVVEKIGGFLDMPGYNYARSRYEKEARLYPDRAFVGSETLPPALYKNWEKVKKIPQLTGDFMWTGWDYLGEAGIGMVRYNSGKKGTDPLIVSAGSGIIDILGKKRPEVFRNRMIWGMEQGPVIAAEPYTHADDKRGISMWRNTDAVSSWSWEGCEGKKSDVLVYAEAASVELFINGRSVGRKKIKEDTALFRKIPYEPGTIRAAAYDAAGGVIGEAELVSAGKETEIRLAAEKTVLRANGQDLAFINVDLTDASGITKSASDQKLTVTVTGPGSLQAFGSAAHYQKERYYKGSHTTYYGKALAIVRASDQPGEITVRVEGEGLAPASLVITVI